MKASRESHVTVSLYTTILPHLNCPDQESKSHPQTNTGEHREIHCPRVRFRPLGFALLFIFLWDLHV